MASPVPQNQEENKQVKHFIYEQRSFAGGMNMQVDPTRLSSDEYPLGVNIRTRYGTAELVKLPLDVDFQGNFVGLKIQGVYSAGPYVLVFAGGRAFFKDIITSPAGAFTEILDFQLDSNVDTIYAEQVPNSSMNYLRQLASSNGDVNGGVNLFSAGSGSPQCVVCQDGLNQPWLIFADGTARKAATYEQWEKDNNREYVPIGTVMLYTNGILYIAGPTTTGSLSSPNRQIFRSVTGRPLDFVVNIDVNGDKGGDASTTAFAVDYDEITAINRLNSNISGFLVSTAKNCYLVSPDTNGQVFGRMPFNEPLFTIQWLHNTGVLNNFSVADKNGDTAFIEFGGIRSFNAVMQNRNEGQNLPFSKKIALLFADIIQSVTASTDYDDYCLFSVQTIYGRAMLVYDTIQDCWIGLDIYSNFTATESIKQFCSVKVGSIRKLYVRTSENKLYELFAGTEYATGQLYLGEWCSNDCNWEQQAEMLKCVFTDVEVDGSVTITPFVDSKRFTPTSLDLKKTTDALVVPLQVPFGAGTADVVRNINFSLDQVDTGWKVGILISWSFGAQLTHVRLESEKYEAAESTDEQAATKFE